MKISAEAETKQLFLLLNNGYIIFSVWMLCFLHRILRAAPRPGRGEDPAAGFSLDTGEESLCDPVLDFYNGILI